MYPQRVQKNIFMKCSIDIFTKDGGGIVKHVSGKRDVMILARSVTPWGWAVPSPVQGYRPSCVPHLLPSHQHSGNRYKNKDKITCIWLCRFKGESSCDRFPVLKRPVYYYAYIKENLVVTDFLCFVQDLGRDFVSLDRCATSGLMQMCNRNYDIFKYIPFIWHISGWVK